MHDEKVDEFRYLKTNFHLKLTSKRYRDNSLKPTSTTAQTASTTQQLRSEVPHDLARSKFIPHLFRRSELILECYRRIERGIIER
ncbi:hypothetical protein HPP92_016432 [Vanilla planifolia]|uniref:Uncharacterized protein n=1 Tax=Vanilla planifolia TaxID=51239 RepID=A0A835QC31_VANPL|nr:hypothetical protein HPP92_017076 [Vanilla planifolia]KAG0471886.1 hypothetical protein HPP92_016432 [Vanilla planifolia]